MDDATYQAKNFGFDNDMEMDFAENSRTKRGEWGNRKMWQENFLQWKFARHLCHRKKSVFAYILYFKRRIFIDRHTFLAFSPSSCLFHTHEVEWICKNFTSIVSGLCINWVLPRLGNFPCSDITECRWFKFMREFFVYVCLFALSLSRHCVAVSVILLMTSPKRLMSLILQTLQNVHISNRRICTQIKASMRQEN